MNDQERTTYWWRRAIKAEARIQAVRDMADRMEASGRAQRPLEVIANMVRRRLDGTDG